MLHIEHFLLYNKLDQQMDDISLDNQNLDMYFNNHKINLLIHRSIVKATQSHTLRTRDVVLIAPKFRKFQRNQDMISFNSTCNNK
jgi:hypothetical protein